MSFNWLSKTTRNILLNEIVHDVFFCFLAWQHNRYDLFADTTVEVSKIQHEIDSSPRHVIIIMYVSSSGTSRKSDRVYIILERTSAQLKFKNV